MRNVLILTLSSVFAAATAVQAANLSDVSGEVLVNTGEGYVAVAAEQPVTLKPGDKILVRENSFATVSFEKCAVALSQPTVFTVTKKQPCEKSASLPHQSLVISPTATDAGGLASEAAFVSKAVSAAIIVGAGAVLIDALGNDNDPISVN
jgi:hypothetical protein